MARVLKIVLGLIIGIVALAVLAVFVVSNTSWGHEQVRTRSLAALNSVAHGVVRINHVDGDLLKGFTLEGVAITDSAGAPFVTVKEVHTNYEIFSFLAKKIDLNNVRFVNPIVVLDRQPNEKWNYDRIFPVDTTGPKKPAKTGLQFGDWLVFHKVQLVDGHLTVRIPWTLPDSLSAIQRDSAVKAALDSSSRKVIVRVANGFQQVEEFQKIDGRLPLVRITHPDFKTRFITVDSLRMLAFAFAPPPADVRQLMGKFEFNSDSVWFAVPSLQLSASHAEGVVGRYTINNGDLALNLVAKPVALNDVQFINPVWPSDGSATMNFALKWVGKTQQYIMHNLNLHTGNATITGDIGITFGDTLKLHETNVKFANVDTKLVQQIMPIFDAPRRGTLTGRARVDGALTGMQIDGDITFRDKLSGVSRVMAVGEIGTDKGIFRTRDLHVTLAPVQVDLARIRVKDFALHGIINGSATLNGATNTGLNFSRIDLTHLEEGERSRFTGSGSFKSGDVPYFSLDAIANPLSLVTVGRFAPAIGLRSSVAGPIKIDGTTRDLAVNATLQSSDGGIISANGRFDLASKDVGYDLKAFTKLFNTNLLVEKAPNTSLSAKMVAKGRGFDPATMQTDVDASVSTSTIDTLAVDSSRVRVRIANGMANVDTFTVHVPGASAEVKGMFGMSNISSGTLTYHAQVDSMAKLARYIPKDTSTVVPRPGPTADKLALARADSEKISQRLMVARAAGIAPSATPIVIDTPPSFHRDTLAGTVVADGSLTGSIASFELQGTATAKDVIALGNTVHRAKATYTWNGVMSDSALADVTASADSVSAAGFALDSVAAHVTYNKPGGKARIAVFQNSRREYAMRTAYAIFPDRQELHFDSLRFRFDTTRWASPHVGGISWGHPGITIDTLEMRNGLGGRIFANGKVPSDGTADLQVAIEKFEVGDLVGLLQSDLALRGMFSADAKFTGSGNAPIITGQANVVNATYGGTVVPEVTTKFDYVNEKLTALATALYLGRQVLTANGTVPINLATSGVTESRLIDGDASVDVKVDSLPLDLSARFTDAVTDVRGFAVGTAMLRGSIRKPKITGDLIVGDAAMRVTALGIKLDTVNGSLHMHGDSLTLDSLTAYSRGRISITGGMGIAKLTEPSFDIKIAADGAQILDTDELGKVRANAAFTIKGPFDAVVVDGTARVREGVLYIPKPDTRESINEGDSIVFAAGDTSMGRQVFVASRPSPLMSNLKMNLMLSVDRDTWVRSKEANVEIYSDGDLRIDVDRKRGSFTLDGVVNSDRGQYTVFSKRF